MWSYSVLIGSVKRGASSGIVRREFDELEEALLTDEGELRTVHSPEKPVVALIGDQVAGLSRGGRKTTPASAAVESDWPISEDDGEAASTVALLSCGATSEGCGTDSRVADAPSSCDSCGSGYISD